MASFRCYDNSDVIATLIMTNFHLNTTVVAIFPNACLWRLSLYSNLVLTLKTNCIKPPSYVSTAYVVVIRPSFLSDSFVKIWATCDIFLGKWFTAPPRQKISRTPVVPKMWFKAACVLSSRKQIAVDNGSMLVLYYLCSQYITSFFFFFLLQVEMYFC